MKSLLFFLLLFGSKQIFAQTNDLISIIKKAEKKCASIKNGHYHFLYAHKYYDSEKDTFFQKGDIIFTKYKNQDSLIAIQQTQKHRIVFGSDTKGFFDISLEDSSYTHNSKNSWTVEDNNFFYPYISLKSSFLTKKANDTNQHISYEGDIIVNNTPCYYIKYKIKDVIISEGLSASASVWYAIRKDNYLPIQYETSTNFMGQNQYTKLTITSSTFNKKVHTKKLDQFLPPSYAQQKTAYNHNILLTPKINDSIPKFNFKNISNQFVNWDNIQHDYILLDFWYLSCFPCKRASGFVDSLYQNYLNKNLFVLGVNPIDTSETQIASFLTQKKINYPTILIPQTAAVSLNVVAYPTFIILDRRTRKVLFTTNGYNEEKKQEILFFLNNSLKQP